MVITWKQMLGFGELVKTKFLAVMTVKQMLGFGEVVLMVPLAVMTVKQMLSFLEVANYKCDRSTIGLFVKG